MIQTFSIRRLEQKGRVRDLPTSSKWQSWDWNPGTSPWMLCLEIPPLHWQSLPAEEGTLNVGPHPSTGATGVCGPREIQRMGFLLFSLAQSLFTGGSKWPPPPRGCRQR